METGKLTPEQLRKHVLCYKGQQRAEILVSAELGEDSAIVDFDGKAAVFSTDPITGAADHAGWLAVHVSANDVFSNGAEPIGCLMTIMAPPACELEDIEQVMKDASRAAAEIGVEICGGHTEVTDAVNRLIISATVFGSAPRQALLRTRDAQAGDAIIVSKTLGLEGSAILARDYADQLRDRFSSEEIETMAAMIERISVAAESRASVQLGVRAMHDITEGGLLGALYEMAEGAGLGFEIDRGAVPLHPLTQRLCEALAIDPLRFLSSGSLLIAAPEGEALLAVLQSAGVEASLLGHFKPEPRKVIIEGTQSTEVQAPQSDELWLAISRLTGARR